MNSNNCDRPGGGETIFLRRRRFVQTHRRTMFVCLNHIKRVKCCCCRELLHPVWYMANIHTGNNGKATSRYQDFVFRRTGTFCWILKLLEKQTSSSSNKAMCDLLNIARVQPNKKTSQNVSRQAPRAVFLPLPNKCLEHKRTMRTKRTIKTHTSHNFANMYLVNGTTTLQEQVSSEAWRRELLVKLTRRWSFSPENCKYKFARPATKPYGGHMWC